MATLTARQSRARHERRLIAVRHAAVIFAPCHLVRIGVQIRASDMMVRSDFGATKAAEKAFRLIGANAFIHERNRVIDALRIPDPRSRWISGHYCDEFAEAHTKELVVREAVGAAIPLAVVGCAIARNPLARLAALNEGRPFAGGTLTEDYELGLRIGELGLKSMFVRMPAVPGSPGVVASRGHFPATFGEAVRQKARWLGGIALTGWDRLGWKGGLGERWMRLRDRRGPIAALLLLCGYFAAFLWSQMWLAQALGAPVQVGIDPMLATLLWINLWLLLWRIAMRAVFTASCYGWKEGLRSIPRVVVGNLIAIVAAARAVLLYLGRQPPLWDKTRHIFPKDLAPGAPA